MQFLVPKMSSEQKDFTKYKFFMDIYIIYIREKERERKRILFYFCFVFDMKAATIFRTLFIFQI